MGTTEIKFDQTKVQELRLICSNCRVVTFHIVVSSADVEDGLFSIKSYRHFQIIQCQGCRNFSFRTVTKYPSEDTKDVKKPRYEYKVETYPPLQPWREMTAAVPHLPDVVARIYHETYKALFSKQPVLAGIGIRALVEAVCQERAAAGRNLEQKIDSLVAMGLLTQENGEFLHGLRILGNEAAHEVKPHQDETLHAAMDVVEHLLETVYVLPATGSKLPRR